MQIEIGELRDCLSLDLQEQAAAIIEKKKHDPNYFMLVWSDVDPVDRNRINSKIFTLPENYQLPQMLGTFCVYVDNKAGRIKSLWNLPLNLPIKGITNEDDIQEEAAVSGVKLGGAIYDY